MLRSYRRERCNDSLPQLLGLDALHPTGRVWKSGGMSVLISNVGIVTVDDEFTVHEKGWIRTEGDLIVGLGAGEAPESASGGRVTHIDGTGHVVMPGMVNAHTHLFQTLFRGLGDDKSLLDWLRDYIWPAAGVMTAAEAELAARIGLVENLRSGVTSVIDHAYIHPDPSIDDAMCRAADAVGLRYLLARGWCDRNYDPKLQETLPEILTRADELRARWGSHPLIRIEHAPLIPWGCSDEAMRATIAASKTWDDGFAGLHVHCAETSTEVTMSLDERGLRHVPWLASVGALGPNTQLAHSVWLNDDELALIAASGASVVHCPVSNMYLASGVARIPEMLAMGIPVSLASDGPGSNNRQDLFEVLKASVLLQKVHTLNPMILQPEDALRMACRGGAQSFGMPSIGALSIGRKADLVLIDLQSVFVAPVHRLPSALVFNVTPRDVRAVLVDGEFRMRDGLCIDAHDGSIVDERALVAQACDAARTLFDRINLKTGLHARG
jgi:5-methylthioadenosine/S-adenosylhomocysteine deaminase